MEVRKILLRYHKRCFICLNQGYISQNFLKKNGCYLHNSAICNTIDEETPENTNVKFYSSEKLIRDLKEVILNLTPLNSKKLKTNTFGSENSKVTTVQQVNFFIATAALLICSTLHNQPLQIAQNYT